MSNKEKEKMAEIEKSLLSAKDALTMALELDSILLKSMSLTKLLIRAVGAIDDALRISDGR